MIAFALALALALAALPCQTAHAHRHEPHWARRAAAPSNSSSSLVPVVCTPVLCLAGQNALTAGVVVSSPVNGSTEQVTLLPGTYTSSSPAFSSNTSSNSSLPPAVFSRAATTKPSNGFSSSGSLASGSSFTVQLLDGVTAYTNALYQGEATYLSLPTNSSSSNASYPSTSIHSLLFSPSTSSTLFALLSTPSNPHLALWSSLPDFSQTRALAAGATVVDVQSVACAKGCRSGGGCGEGGRKGTQAAHFLRRHMQLPQRPLRLKLDYGHLRMQRGLDDRGQRDAVCGMCGGVLFERGRRLSRVRPNLRDMFLPNRHMPNLPTHAPTHLLLSQHLHPLHLRLTERDIHHLPLAYLLRPFELVAQAPTERGKWKMPWWAILVVLLCVAVLVVVGVLIWRRREQRRRREQTARFARDLGDKEVDKKLAALPISIAYPPVPRASSPSLSSSFSYLSPARLPPRRPTPPPPLDGKDLDDVPLTPRFILEDPSSPISPTPSRSSYAPSARPPPRARGEDRRWSNSSFGTARVWEQKAGESARTFKTQAGNTLTIQSKNPYLGRI
ncbi:hypothetical protein Rt10032_c08g3514 [Rhodotorula toruloides]|uniref:Proteophosphoglycan ppg4 n=1 Tax=Rhodotorula toruloides TaxID=5286 RepID=A0A511KGJ7_RHOTO|nr:hypothetical protein Rt10032_c08g3514 [Rhodotorula toruloides]